MGPTGASGSSASGTSGTVTVLLSSPQAPNIKAQAMTEVIKTERNMGSPFECRVLLERWARKCEHGWRPGIGLSGHGRVKWPASRHPGKRAPFPSMNWVQSNRPGHRRPVWRTTHNLNFRTCSSRLSRLPEPVARTPGEPLSHKSLGSQTLDMAQADIGTHQRCRTGRFID